LFIIGGFLNMAEISVLEYVIGGLLGILGIALIVIIMMQQSIRKGLSGAISGGASETFYGKNKRKSKAKVLNRVTAALSTVFAVLVLSLYIVHTVTTNNKAEEASKAAASAAAQSQPAADTASEANYETSN
jgi:preprotein translocase subunit SecG